VVANNPGVARVAFSQLMQLLENNKFDTRLRELMIMRIVGSPARLTSGRNTGGGGTGGDPARGCSGGARLANSTRLTLADKAILTATDECLAGIYLRCRLGRVAKHVTDPGQQVEFIIAWATGCRFRCCSETSHSAAEGLTVWPPAWSGVTPRTIRR